MNFKGEGDDFLLLSVSNSKNIIQLTKVTECPFSAIVGLYKDMATIVRINIDMSTHHI